MTISLEQLGPLIGLPHCDRTHDCADLVTEAAAHLYGRQISLPQARPRPRGTASRAAALDSALTDLALRIDSPADGDLVLMTDLGFSRPSHIGMYFFLGYEHRVLHSSQGVGSSRLHRLSDLPRFGLTVVGYYRWK